MNLTPDGVRYLAVARGERVARPFHLRWLVPYICKERAQVWRAVNIGSLLCLLPAAFWYGGTGWRGLTVAAFAFGLSGVWKFNRRHPVLVDAPAMTLALFAAGAAKHHLWWLAVLIAVVAGATKETAPLFAALWAWSLVPLCGLIAPTLRFVQRAGDDVLDAENAWILKHPIQASRKYHKGFQPWVWALPWGAALVGVGHMSWPLAAVLVAAYGQCLIATDTIRLYQWAYPALAVAATRAVDARWWPLLVLLTFVNPFAGDGA